VKGRSKIRLRLDTQSKKKEGQGMKLDDQESGMPTVTDYSDPWKLPGYPL
jgi:hypothetical protein